MKPNTPSRPSVPVDLIPHLQHALDLMDRNYAEPLDLDVVAAQAGVSKYHFLRCFAATYGQTPAQYLCHRRIERAQDLLRATNLTVTEICNLVGCRAAAACDRAPPSRAGGCPQSLTPA